MYKGIVGVTDSVLPDCIRTDLQAACLREDALLARAAEARRLVQHDVRVARQRHVLDGGAAVAVGRPEERVAAGGARVRHAPAARRQVQALRRGRQRLARHDADGVGDELCFMYEYIPDSVHVVWHAQRWVVFGGGESRIFATGMGRRNDLHLLCERMGEMLGC